MSKDLISQKLELIKKRLQLVALQGVDNSDESIEDIKADFEALKSEMEEAKLAEVKMKVEETTDDEYAEYLIKKYGIGVPEKEANENSSNGGDSLLERITAKDDPISLKNSMTRR